MRGEVYEHSAHSIHEGCHLRCFENNLWTCVCLSIKSRRHIGKTKRLLFFFNIHKGATRFRVHPHLFLFLFLISLINSILLCAYWSLFFQLPHHLRSVIDKPHDFIHHFSEGVFIRVALERNQALCVLIQRAASGIRCYVWMRRHVDCSRILHSVCPERSDSQRLWIYPLVPSGTPAIVVDEHILQRFLLSQINNLRLKL